jgi:hypothetical protein
VRITNTGRVAYAIPWEPDWTRIGDVPGRRVVSCMVHLVIGSQPLSLGSIPIFDSAAWLYGSEDAPGTLKTLAPGGSVSGTDHSGTMESSRPRFRKTVLAGRVPSQCGSVVLTPTRSGSLYTPHTVRPQIDRVGTI